MDFAELLYFIYMSEQEATPEDEEDKEQRKRKPHGLPRNSSITYRR